MEQIQFNMLIDRDIKKKLKKISKKRRLSMSHVINNAILRELKRKKYANFI